MAAEAVVEAVVQVGVVKLGRIHYADITPDYELVAEDSPIVSSMCNQLDGIEGSVEAEFYFPEAKGGKTPFYVFSEAELTHIHTTSESMYNLMVDSLDLLFSNKYKHLIDRFYGNEFLTNHRDFIDYAIYTFKNNHESIYGRFDIAYDFDNKKILGFYELNGDTPVMLFESVVMQKILCEQIGKSTSQSNLYYENLVKNIKKVISGSDKNIAFLCDFSAVEDALTTECLYHAFNDNSDHLCLIQSLDELEYELMYSKAPFHINGSELDYIFALYPWEEMIDDFSNLKDSAGNKLPSIMADWKKWADKTRFFEPAWRWFVSNKGVWAWLTHVVEVLQHEDESVAKFVKDNHAAWEYLIPAYMEKRNEVCDYVRKPLMGRISNNIEVYKSDELVSATDGFYGDDTFIYQDYRDTTSADGVNKAIICTWLAPYGDKPLWMESSTLAVREFSDSDMLKAGNERYMPHIISDDMELVEK